MGYRQAPAERENQEGWGPFWRWFFAALFFWLAVSFFGKAEASVLGHDSLESCENAVAAIARGDAPHGTSYSTEKDFYALSHQPYYLKDGNCYQTNEDLKEQVEWIEVATATSAGGTGIIMTARAAAASGAIKALKRATAAVFGSITAGVIIVHKDWPNPINILAGLNGRAVATIWKNPCLGVTFGEGAGLPTGQILSHCEQMVPESGDIEDSDRILVPTRASSSKTEPVPTLSDVLAKARDRFNNGEFSGSLDPVGDAIRAEYSRVQSMMNQGEYSAADKKKFTQLLEDIAQVLGAYYAALHMEYEDEPHVIPSVWPTLPGID